MEDGERDPSCGALPLPSSAEDIEVVRLCLYQERPFEMDETDLLRWNAHFHDECQRRTSQRAFGKGEEKEKMAEADGSAEWR